MIGKKNASKRTSSGEDHPRFEAGGRAGEWRRELPGTRHQNRGDLCASERQMAVLVPGSWLHRRDDRFFALDQSGRRGGPTISVQSLARNKPFPPRGSSTPANMPLIRSQSLELQAEGALEENRRHRPGPYLNNAWSRIIGRSNAGATLDDVIGNVGVTSRTHLG